MDKKAQKSVLFWLLVFLLTLLVGIILISIWKPDRVWEFIEKKLLFMR